MRGRWADRVAGVAVGIVLGLGVLVYFVFVHSEGAIDAPKISETGSGGSTAPETASPPATGTPSKTEEGGGTPARPKSKARPVPVVKVIGGAPPTGGGPKQLDFRVGEKVRFEIDTDEPFSFEIRGLGIEKTIESSSIVSFEAKRAGQFPVIGSTTLIGVADLLIKKQAGK